MEDNGSSKQPKTGPVSDGIFIVLFLLMLATVLAGQRPMAALASLFGLGPGWPELMQGGLGFLLLILLGVRGLQLGIRARRQRSRGAS